MIRFCSHNRPDMRALKMTPQEIKAFPAFSEIDHPGLVRVQVQTQPAQQGRSPGMSLLGLFHGPADHHEVVRVADQLPGALLGPRPIERMQVNVGQQRGNDPALGCPGNRLRVTTPSANTPAPSHCRISFSTRRSETRRSTSTINRSWSIDPKKSRMSASNTNLPPRGNATRITSKASVATASRAEPETARQEVGLENRFQDQLRRLLHHPIAHSGNTQRPPPAIRLGDLHPPHRRRVIHPRGGDQHAVPPTGGPRRIPPPRPASHDQHRPLHD